VRFLLFALLLAACSAPQPPTAEPVRIAAWNIEDLRTSDVLDPDHVRINRAVTTIGELAPDVLLLSELTYDVPGVGAAPAGGAAGQNAARMAERIREATGLRYVGIGFASNTGEVSGYDLDRSGEVVTAPPPVQASADVQAPRQTLDERAYGGDTWGFGVYPGQYAFALFVREGIEVQTERIRTFRTFRWADMPGALLPTVPETGEPWYDGVPMRLSSKTHADVPVTLPSGETIHLLLSHPTPPAFDGPEARNKRRNHDEIRLWRAYIDGADWIYDDAGQSGGLALGARFVVMGDLNADPDEGNALDDPIGNLLLASPRVQDVRPQADAAGRARYPDLDPDDTAMWGQMVDYVLPSTGLRVVDSGQVRPDTAGVEVSDHFAVWIDVVPVAVGETGR
jgi:endonuclease/exonuclease/phosphatase family metal-dependent hydrolase